MPHNKKTRNKEKGLIPRLKWFSSEKQTVLKKTITFKLLCRLGKGGGGQAGGSKVISYFVIMSINIIFTA